MFLKNIFKKKQEEKKQVQPIKPQTVQQPGQTVQQKQIQIVITLIIKLLLQD